ncbi:Dyp-type peroxidase [Streptosporangium lutulentum]
MDARRLLPGRPADPDAHRDLGPHLAEGTGGHLRPHQARGRPYGGTREHDPVALDKLPIDSHVRLAHPDSLGGATILRRGYSFTDGSDGLGRLDAGLFFLAYQRDLEKGFIPIQRALAAKDTLNEYIQHVGSGVFACPGGVSPGSFWGAALLA